VNNRLGLFVCLFLSFFVLYCVKLAHFDLRLPFFSMSGSCGVMVVSKITDHNVKLAKFTDPYTDPHTLRYQSRMLLGIAVADYNGDGKPDIALSTYGAKVWIFYNSAVKGGARTVSFQKWPEKFVSGWQTVNLITRDINGDGRADLVVVNEGDASMTVMINNRKGPHVRFNITRYRTGRWPAGLAAGNWNNNSFTDLVVLNSGESSISLFSGTSFQQPTVPPLFFHLLYGYSLARLLSGMQ